MENIERRPNRLPQISLTILVMWLLVGTGVATSLYWYPWSDPQGWDKLLVTVILFWGSIVAALLSSAVAIFSLVRTANHATANPERRPAIAAIVLSVMLLGFMIWFLWG